MICTVIGVSISWFILIILQWWKIEERCGRFRMIKHIKLLREQVVPLIGNSGFQPILSIFLTVFVCDLVKGKDSVIEKSVLSIDCTQYCWSNIHIVYSVISALILIPFTSLVIYYKPLWQSDRSEELHIIQTPYIMLIESLLQVYFVILNKVVKRSYKLAHSILFIAPLSIYLIFTLIKDAYNYKRTGAWQKMCLLGVIWIAIISTLESTIGNEIILPWYALLLIGWAIIMIGGIILMRKKYPSYLTTQTRNITELFKFQLTRVFRRIKLTQRTIPISLSESPMSGDSCPLSLTSHKQRPSSFPESGYSFQEENIENHISQRLNILPILFNPK
jgi:hypothetical protein